MISTKTFVKRSAFTMIELVMVIVILGIVSMMATDIISNMYKSYIQTKIINDLEQKTELLINQLGNRLQYRIKKSMIARKKGTATYLAMNSNQFVTDDYNMVEWIGIDNEGKLGAYDAALGFNTPLWSGFLDVESSDTSNFYNTYSTPGSNFSKYRDYLIGMSEDEVTMGDHTKQAPAIYFKCTPAGFDISHYWKPNLHRDDKIALRMGYTAKTAVMIGYADDHVKTRSICEQYDFAWSAYALVPEGGDVHDFNLTLHYNYQPWYDEAYNSSTTRVSTLAEHVSTFRIIQIGETLRIKVCIQDGNITGEPIGFCKEKAIF